MQKQEKYNPEFLLESWESTKQEKKQSNKLRILENTSWRFSELALLWYHVRTQLQQWWRENVVKEREIEWM